MYIYEWCMYVANVTVRHQERSKSDERSEEYDHYPQSVSGPSYWHKRSNIYVRGSSPVRAVKRVVHLHAVQDRIVG